MKEFYSEIKLEIVDFTAEDVIVCSPNDERGENETEVVKIPTR